MDEKNEYEIKIKVSTEVNQTPVLPKAYTWPVVALVLLFFWPVGIFLMHKRFNIDKTPSLERSKTISLIAYGFFAMTVIYLIMSITGQFQYFTAVVFFAAGGAFLLYDARRIKNTPNPVVEDSFIETKVVTCSSCGANNTVTVGKTTECEYCGTPLQ